MIQEEFEELVFEFAKKASRYKKVAYIFLFGSIAKGEADRRSDIDLLVVFDTDKNDITTKEEISNLALSLEKKYDRNIQIIFTNKNFDGLDEYFIKEVIHEGILLYGVSPIVEVKGLELEPYTLMLYNLKKFTEKEKRKLKRLLYGHKTKKEVNGKMYRSEKRGLVEVLNGKHIGRGAIIIPKTKAHSLEKELEKVKIAYKRIDMWLAEDDVVKINV